MAENHHSASEPPPKISDLGRWTAAIVLILLICGFYWRLTLTSQYTWLGGGDTASQVLPWFQFQAGEWHRGRLPLWDPNHWAGQPLIGQAQPGAAYPLNWILFLLPLRDGWIKQVHLHWYFVCIHILAAWFAYRLGRELGCRRISSLLGAAVFSLAGWLGTTEWPQMINGAVWAPLVFLYLFRAVRGRAPVASAVLSGFFLGVAWLSGHHQIPIFLTITASAVWLWAGLKNRRLLPLLPLFLVVTFCAGALQILPAQEYGRAALRWVGAPDPIGWKELVPYSVHQEYSLHPASLLGIVFPGMTVHSDPFLGVAALALALLGIALCWQRWETRALTAVMLGSLLFSLAHHTPLNGLLYGLAPLLDKARSPSMAVFVTGFAAAMLAAMGLEALLAERGSPWPARASKAALALGCVVFTVRFVIVEWRGFPGGAEQRELATALAAIFLAWLLYAWRARSISARTAAFLFLGIFLLEVANANGYYMPALHEKERLSQLNSLRENSDIAEFLRRQPGMFRVDIDDKLIPYNFGDWYGIQQSGGYLAGITENVARQEFHNPAAKRLLGVAYAIGDKPTAFQTEQVFQGASGLKVFYNADVLPRAFAVHEAFQIPHRNRAAAELTQLGSDLGKKTFLLVPPPPLQRCEATDSVTLLSSTPNRVRLAANMGCAGMAILTDTFYPGWVAKVDGKDADIYEAYAFVRGVAVGAGDHTIEFSYRPGSVIWGGILSGLAALAAIAAARSKSR
jgi:hypothetical protein